MQDLENACDAPLTALIKVQYHTINSYYLFMANLTRHVMSPQLHHPRKNILTGVGILPRGDKKMYEM